MTDSRPLEAFGMADLLEELARRNESIVVVRAVLPKDAASTELAIRMTTNRSAPEAWGLLAMALECLKTQGTTME